MKIKLIAILLIIAVGVLTLFVTVSSSASKTKEYNSYIAQARANAENQVPYVAIMNYQKAFGIKCNNEKLYIEYIEQAKLVGEDFYEVALDNYIKYFPKSSNAYELLCNQQYESANYKGVIEIALEARSKGIATENIKNKYMECFYQTRVVQYGFEEATSFLGNVALVKRDGLYGYINSSHAFVIAPTYQEASMMFNGVAAVNDGKEWYVINSSGFKIARPSEKVDYLSFENNGYLVIGKGGKYSYTDKSLSLPSEYKYDYASVFKNDVAAVKKDNKWALVGSNGKMITDFIYDDIKIDEYGACINNGIVFAKRENKYYMLNAKGAEVSKQTFDDAYPFVGAEPAAVCVEGKWGFVDVSGNFVIEPQYTEAKSFSIGLAPVSENGVWGYIDINNKYLIEKTYSNAKPFTSNGIAAVYQNNVWNYIQLLGYSN